MKKWKCTVCGYIHVGDEPPEICPVCKADKSKFVLLEEKQESFGLEYLLSRFHLHPIMSHLPNALFPVSLLFLILYMLYGNPKFECVSFYMVIAGTIAAPLTLLSGMLDWIILYKKGTSSIFPLKIKLGIALTVVGLVLIFLHSVSPNIVINKGFLSYIYLVILGCASGMVGVLGYLGGKLVFGR